MRLLNTKSLELEEFIFSKCPDYVILSHRWGLEEITFEDMTSKDILNPDSAIRQKHGFSKVQGACKLAIQDGYDWIWIDTCCIDKKSSAELQEDINTMWYYYEGSNICYVYMQDVPNQQSGWSEAFERSDWFTRSWTLQELIAPRSLEFYAKDWSPIGTKFQRHREISNATNISTDVLVKTRNLQDARTAEKLSWAAHRKVTREEDETYSLLGLFDVNMPLLYGEGRQNAFARFQEVIHSRGADDSLFLFRYSPHARYQAPIADTPAQFCRRINCTTCGPYGTSVYKIKCFPDHISYATMVDSKLWGMQASEPITTRVARSGTEISATFSMISYREIIDQLIDLGNTAFNKDDVTYVALLNQTLVGYPLGTLCLLLFGGHQGAAFGRTRYYPAILPDVEQFIPNLERKRIIMWPDSNRLAKEEFSEVDFALVGNPSHRSSWSAKNIVDSSRSMAHGNRNPEFRVKSVISHKLEVSSPTAAEVACHISDPQNPNSQILLRLINSHYTWSLREVFEVGPGRAERILFSSFALCDGCSIRLSDGRTMGIRIRRLASSRRGQREECIRKERYQIVLGSL